MGTAYCCRARFRTEPFRRFCTRTPYVCLSVMDVIMILIVVVTHVVRWDPNRQDKRFFNQSVVLWAAYYHIQILIHRPFIPSPGRPSPLSFPSLAICTNAARSCIHVVDVLYKRTPKTSPQVQVCLALLVCYLLVMSIILVDGGFYIWYCAAVEYLGREEVGFVDGSK